MVIRGGGGGGGELHNSGSSRNVIVMAVVGEEMDGIVVAVGGVLVLESVAVRCCRGIMVVVLESVMKAVVCVCVCSPMTGGSSM